MKLFKALRRVRRPWRNKVRKKAMKEAAKKRGLEEGIYVDHQGLFSGGREGKDCNSERKHSAKR